ncbi:dihydroneopterin aldolase [Microbacterium sp. M3]|uniref:7,8-dihydroneopterin aldolase n=1 Tax=Microbacterium arthrosphaerae TaxID=792652 RepID=A0ABU4H2S4_9MICO|nr:MULTISPECIES: dihydroneopterin aldolase [Microbacterium]MDW4573636.1 dihydroneopterin aldolase [Microbacterium arthrosphaerae]MDW7607491.1 dihydroneopterin aldolase [Microbacterium sp. M3]
MDVLDEITLTGVRAFGYHGVFPEERREGQEFVVDVTLRLSTARAAASDDVADTVHYGEVAERIVAVVAGEPRNLIESVAARIADDLLTYDLIESLAVTIHKPQAPITVPFSDVAVTVHRSRHDRAGEAVAL